MTDEGSDTLDFAATVAAVAIDLASASVQVVVGPVGSPNLQLTLSAGDVVENIVGGAGNDTLSGNALDNVLTGGAGNDSLVGGAGNDTYVFDADNLSGSDTIMDASGIDALEFAASTIAITVNLGSTAQQNVASAGGANLRLTLTAGNALENIVGGVGNDTLTGNALDNVLIGGAGDDSLVGGAGNDTYVFDADVSLGSDTITELVGGGTDTLDFSTVTAAVTIDLSSNTQQTVVGQLGTPNLRLTLSAGNVIENVMTGSGDDTITANAQDNVLIGGAGNDNYRFDADSASGQDTVTELADGGSDTLDFSATTAAVTVNLGLATQQTVTTNLVVTLSANNVFENVVGGAGKDSLTGNTLANVLTGGSGDDTLTGGTGNDTYTFDADDALGSDELVELPNEGTDLLDFAATSGAVTLSLGSTSQQDVAGAGGANLQLTLSGSNSFENVLGGSGADLLTGNTGANRLAGGAGNDTLYGATGTDTYVFQEGWGDDTFANSPSTADNNPHIEVAGAAVLEKRPAVSDQMQIRLTGTGETLRFKSPSASLHITGTVTLGTLDPGYAGTLKIDGVSFTTGTSLVTSGNIEIYSNTISITHDITTTGDIKLIVNITKLPDQAFGFQSDLLAANNLKASISIVGAHLSGRNIEIQAYTNNDGGLDLEAEGEPNNIYNTLFPKDPNGDLSARIVRVMQSVGLFFSATFARAESVITIGADTTIEATGTVTITAEAHSATRNLTISPFILALTVTTSTANATVTVADGARIEAGGTVTIHAEVGNNISARSQNLSLDSLTSKPTLNKFGGVDIVGVVAVANSHASVTVSAGAHIESRNGSVLIDTVSRKDLSAIAKGGSALDRFALSFAVQVANTTANTYVAGTILAGTVSGSGNVKLASENDTLQFITDASMWIGEGDSFAKSALTKTKFGIQLFISLFKSKFATKRLLTANKAGNLANANKTAASVGALRRQGLPKFANVSSSNADETPEQKKEREAADERRKQQEAEAQRQKEEEARKKQEAYERTLAPRKQTGYSGAVTVAVSRNTPAPSSPVLPLSRARGTWSSRP